jgi:rhomboid family GlyGly-CTERM serine protease
MSMSISIADGPLKLSRFHRFPRGLVTLFLAVVAITALVVPGLGDSLALRRVAVEHGAWWQLFTGHLAHFGTEHLLWDVAAFGVLGFLAENRSLHATLATLAGSALFISLATLFFAPGISEYRGLSGIDSALFTLVAVSMCADFYRTRAWASFTLITLFLTAFVAKVGFEFTTGHTLFVQHMGSDVRPVALAHVVGGVWGCVVAIAGFWPDLLRKLFRGALPACA